MKDAKNKIEWVKNPDGTPGYTWNPISGCLNGCPYCYARTLANGRLKARYLANNNLAPLIGEGPVPYHTARLLYKIDPFYPRFWPDKLKEVTKSHKGSKGIFVCSMSDLFGIGIPYWWTKSVLDFMMLRPDYRFYLLTKQPQNLHKWGFLGNCYVGVTVTDSAKFQFATAHLHNIEAKVKYLSIEPLLSWDMGATCMAGYLEERGISWLIIGSQTNPTVMPRIEWVSEIVQAADRAGVKVFLKDSLKPLLSPDCELPSWARKPYSINILRQEMP